MSKLWQGLSIIGLTINSVLFYVFTVENNGFAFLPLIGMICASIGLLGHKDD